MGFVAFGESHEGISMTGIKIFWGFYFIRWASLLSEIAFLIPIEWGDNTIYLASIITVLLLPGTIIGILIYKFDQSYEVIAELKNTIKAMLKYGNNAKETIENLLKLVIVMTNILVQGMYKLVTNVLGAIIIRGIANSIFHFSLINPESYSSLSLDFGHGETPPLIAHSMVNNVNLAVTGFFHGLVFSVIPLFYILNFGTSITGYVVMGINLIYFPLTIISFVNQLIYFKSIKKTICSLNVLFHKKEAIAINRTYINAYFNVEINRHH